MSILEPIRENLSWEEKWKGPDNVLIICWETGRKLREQNSKLKQKADRGELPPSLGWKGCGTKTIKGEKFGTLKYLAQLQGLKGLDLNIDIAEGTTLTCAKTGMNVTYTGDISKWANR